MFLSAAHESTDISVLESFTVSAFADMKRLFHRINDAEKIHVCYGFGCNRVSIYLFHTVTVLFKALLF